jgi:hypothetical protein
MLCMIMAESTLRYLQLDFDAQVRAAQERIRARYPGVWNDFASKGFGDLIIDINAYSAETLAYLINRAAAENFRTTLTLPESAIRLGANFNYRLRGPGAAVVLCEAQLAGPVVADVRLPKGSSFTAGVDGDVRFELTRDYTITAGSLTPSTTAIKIDPLSGGADVIQTAARAVAGLPYLDMLDTAVDLRNYVGAGMVALVDGVGEFVVTNVGVAPGAISYNRLSLARNWDALTGDYALTVVERRVAASQGQTLTEQATTGTDTSAFQVRLTRGPVIELSWSVTVNDVAWTYVDNLVLSGGQDEVYEVRRLPSDVYLVTFGDGRFGAQLPSDARVNVTYRVGGGTNGNVAAGAVSTSVVGLLNDLTAPVTVTLTNLYAGGVGGTDAETVEEARANIPAHIAANDRGVTGADYQTLALRFNHPNYGQVRYARVEVRDDYGLVEKNQVIIYAWSATTGGALTSLNGAAKSALREYVQSKAVGTDYVLVADGTARPVPVSVRARAIEGADTVAVTQGLLAALKATINALRPGDQLAFSDIIRALNNVPDVRSVVLATPINDLVPATPNELLTPPDDDVVYALDLAGVDGNEYVAQSPIVPLAAWSVRVTLGTTQLTIVPDLEPGYAWCVDVSNVGAGLDTTKRSRLNLRTGQFQLFINGAPGDLSVRLNTTQVFDRERVVNVYVGYESSNNSDAKRREIRSVLRAWAENAGVGLPLYGREVTGLLASRSNVTDVVRAVAGVVSVTRVALESPGNADARIIPGASELITLGNVVLNNVAD